MAFLKIRQQHPDSQHLSTDAVISTDHIVRIIEVHYEEDANGEKWVARIEKLTPEEIAQGIRPHYLIYDIHGNEYDSLHLTQEGYDLLISIWNSAK